MAWRDDTEVTLKRVPKTGGLAHGMVLGIARGPVSLPQSLLRVMAYAVVTVTQDGTRLSGD